MPYYLPPGMRYPSFGRYADHHWIDTVVPGALQHRSVYLTPSCTMLRHALPHSGSTRADVWRGHQDLRSSRSVTLTWFIRLRYCTIRQRHTF